MRSDASASVSVAPRRVKHRAPDAPDAPRISDEAERLLAGDDQQDDPAEAAEEGAEVHAVGLDATERELRPGRGSTKGCGCQPFSGGDGAP